MSILLPVFLGRALPQIIGKAMLIADGKEIQDKAPDYDAMRLFEGGFKAQPENKGLEWLMNKVPGREREK